MSTLTIYANFWPRTEHMQSLEDQYADLWTFAKSLQSIGIPLDEWFPPADTQANSLLNNSFNEMGVTTQALAMAKADKENHSDIRNLGAWNGKDEVGGMALTTKVSGGPFPCNFDFSANEIEPLKSYDHVLKAVQTVLDTWSPPLVLVGPPGYDEKKVFKDRPAVSWMIYLPFKIETSNVPEAAQLIPILGKDKKRRGTLVVSTTETFDAENKDHVKRANDIEIRLADQDLLPRFMDFMKLR